MNPYEAALLAQATRMEFEWGRIQSDVDWLPPIAVTLAAVAYVVYMYRRDAAELRAGVGVVLAALRVAALVALGIVYLQPQYRTIREVVENSRVLVLADTSLSMAPPSEPERAAELAAAFARDGLIDQIRRKHDVVVARFDEGFSRITTLPRLEPEPHGEPPQDSPTNNAANDTIQDPETKNQNVPLSAASELATPMDWNTALAPSGAETRLAQAVRELLNEERGGPISGLVILSDGQQNAGIEPTVAAASAREAEIPIYAVGLGSDRQPVNVRISDFVAPVRAYPGDRFGVVGYLQAQGYAGRTVTVELSSRPAAEQGSSDEAGWELEESQEVVLGADGEVVPVRFQIAPRALGRRTLRLLVSPPTSDAADENRQEADVEIVDRKTRVLLFAGGPSREYQFLRNQLQRDKDVVVDVFLQTASDGASQDANEILSAFPSSIESLSEYDVIVAFDPDWRALDARQQEMLDRWVAEQAGGLVLVAGSIHTAAIVQDPGLERIRALYPVEFQKRFALLDDVRYGSKDPWPLEFTREGLEADFLWLDESAVASQRLWNDFEGVYSYQDVRGAKPAATVFARYSDPRAGGDELPVYFASQFYGAGRVFYLGSGEMWRLRSQADAYFERFYTKVLRYVSQGRLLRGSPRGVLLVERYRYLVGATIDVRAQLRDAQLNALELPSVPLSVLLPDRSVQTVTLDHDASRAGSYGGQFVARDEGVYRLELSIPETSGERLTTSPIQVLVPNIEREDVRRNDALLSAMTTATGGDYFVGLEAATASQGSQQPPLAERLVDKSITLPISGSPEPLWDKSWVMYVLCGLLCVEWLIRRLNRLA